MLELPLSGGFVNSVVRVGDTVRRPLGTRFGFVHELLDLFERAGWAAAPRILGTDERSREILSFLDGHVAWEPCQPAGGEFGPEPGLCRPTGPALPRPDGRDTAGRRA